MGEHDTWWNLLNYLPGWQGFVHVLEENLGRTVGAKAHFVGGPLQESEFGLSHVLSAMLVALFLIFGAFAYRGALARAGRGAIVPPKTFNLRNLFEMFAEA